MSPWKLYLKRDSNKDFSREFWELFKSTYFVEDLRTTGSEAPVQGSLFNKDVSLTAGTHLTVLFCRYFSVNFVEFSGKPL